MGSCKEKAVIRLPLERTDFFIWTAQKSENLKQKRDIGYIARYVIVKLELKLEMRRDLSRIYFVYQNAINRVKK